MLSKCYIAIIVFLLVMEAWCVQGLDTGWTDSIAGMNCSSFLHLPKANNGLSQKYITNNDDTSSSTKNEMVQNHLECPPWYIRNNNTCKRGSNLHSIIIFMDRTGQTWLEPFYCMTTAKIKGLRLDIVGGCLFSTAVNRRNTYYPLPCNVSKLNEYTCAKLNRDGQLCGKCKDGFAPPAYSYFLNCVNCTDYSQSWLKYIAVAYGPLTVFSTLIMLVHISPTSPYLHGFIFYCHIISMQPIIRLLVVSNGYSQSSTAFDSYCSFLGIWNLDFFRLVYTPFCVSPHLSVLHVLALDYLIAFYPILLVSVTYILVSLYSRNCRLIVNLWKPFRCIFQSILRNLDIRTSLIESFATMYFLSTIKFQSVTLDILSPNILYYPNGSRSKEIYLYLAGNIEYFGPHHWPFAALAIFLFIFVIIFPTFLLFVYPCRCFQQCLNKTHCNTQGLRAFMDVFQGHYKNGTNQSKDFRYFSGVYFVARTVFVSLFALLNSYEALITISILLAILTVFVAMSHPQLTNFHYIVDCIFLLALTLLFISGAGYILVPNNSALVTVSMFLIIGSLYLPLFYIIGITLYWVFVEKKLPQRMLRNMYTCAT